MPCSSPLLLPSGQKVACKSCDFCVGRRVHSWCARAMMEKESMGHALVLAMTYNDETEHSRRSAAMFDYMDVSDFLKNLRRQVEYHMGKKSAVSFIAAGEQGERFKRCHWHVVIFSEVDITTVGKWSASFGPVSARSEIITPPAAKVPWRRVWSLWRYGYVTVQEPDYVGMRYAMAYALKDQFNWRNAQFTARAGSAEVFSQGYLVMSKKPPIGARWIDAYVERCRVSGVVPPTRQLTVAGLDRPYWPAGLLSDRLLAGLASVNEEVKARTGRDGAGWSTLLHEARLSDNDLEIMGAIGEQERQEKDASESATGGLRLEASHKWRAWRDARVRYLAEYNRPELVEAREARAAKRWAKKGHGGGSGPSEGDSASR